jgi:lysophospholipase L1-like esterase
MLPRPVFVLFGDSLTQRGHDVGGWGARLAHHYGRRADVLNRGYSGYTTAWALHLLPRLFPPASTAPPALVTICFGANDSARDPPHAVPLPAYSANLRACVEAVRAAGCSRVLLVTPPPVYEPNRQLQNTLKWNAAPDAPSERTRQRTRQYADACLGVGAELGCPVVDAFAGFLEASPEAWHTHLLCDDGLHFAPGGDEALFTLVAAAVERAFPELAVQTLPYDAPEHFDIDRSDPARSFADWGR